MYNHKEIEKKWQDFWEKNKTFKTENPEIGNHSKFVSASLNDKNLSKDSGSSPEGQKIKPKRYSLDMFPYPSGAGLHVGHPEGFTANDIIARYKHAKGYNVLHPMGWDAFGLPAENYAINTGTHPRITTDENIKTFKTQLKKLGFSYDWDREIDTTDPDYYKWTQWIFLKLFEAGLAYEQDLPINYCLSCKTGLANEEVLNDFTCERCGTKVEKKKIRQWVLAITKYADRLLNDVDKLDWPESIKDMQRNWIGKSEGCEFRMRIAENKVGMSENDNHRISENKRAKEEFGDKTYEIIGLAMKVQNEIGSGLQEKIYKKGLKLILEKNGFKVEEEVEVEYKIEGEKIGYGKVDLLVNGKIAIELKSRKNLEGDYYKQLRSYINQSKNIETGLLLNFYNKKLEYKRLEKNYKQNSQVFLESDSQLFISVYTTRIDTVFGMTYAVLAPDHPQVLDFITDENKKECLDYIEKAKKKSDQDRIAENKEKTGVFTGSYVINPFNNEKVPLWIADYVLGNYGTGAVMAVPAHDERDFEFAKKYGLEIRQSVAEKILGYGGGSNLPDKTKETICKNSVTAIVQNNNGTEFLLLDWKKANWITFVTGCVEENESFEDTIVRELKEETGYIDFEIINEGREFFQEALHSIKKINYKSNGRVYVVRLNSEKKLEISKEELDKHTPRWVKKENVLKELSFEDQKTFFTELFLDNKAFTEYGILVNSGEFSGLTSEEAKIKMTEFATKNGFGEKKVNYKLRDWLFSRQRYWGEPIPLIHLEDKDLDKLISLNFYEEKIIDSIISGSKTIETRALNPEEKDRYFGDIKSGDAVIFTDKIKDIKYLVKIKNIKKWKNLEELYKDKESLEKIFSNLFSPLIKGARGISSKEELKKLYSFTPDYLEKIEKNGLIGFEFEIISQIYEGLYSKIVCDYNLPLKLPEVEEYAPAGDGNSPLIKVKEFVNIKLANNLSGKRETNTMPQWGGSCWYYLRFMDPKNPNELVNKEIEAYWGQVDSYVGGAEHAVLHLLYARFWHKFLFDIGVVSYDEPFYRLRNQGLILAHAFERKNGGLLANDLVEEKDGKYYEISSGEEVNRIISKMSKSLKNVINPDDIVEEYGADSLRLYEMYMAEFKDTAPWDTKGIIGVRRFLEKSERLFTPFNIGLDSTSVLVKISNESDEFTMKLLHKTIKKVEEDIENYKFNTAIAQLMILVNNGLPKDEKLQIEWKSVFVRLLHPFAPHLAEELNSRISENNGLGISENSKQRMSENKGQESIFFSVWPEYDEEMTKDDEVTIGVQVLGKLRGEITIGVDEDENIVLEKAKNNESVKKWLEGKEIIKEIYVKGKIVNIVVR